MSRRIDKSWVVFSSVENDEHDRCVDFFYRPDGTHGFEEFRRDVEDAGLWTPTQYFSGKSFDNADQAAAQAKRSIEWYRDHNR